MLNKMKLKSIAWVFLSFFFFLSFSFFMSLFSLSKRASELNILCFHFGKNYLLPDFCPDKQKHSPFLPFPSIGIWGFASSSSLFPPPIYCPDRIINRDCALAFSLIDAPVVMKAFKKSKETFQWVCLFWNWNFCGRRMWVSLFFHLLFPDVYHLMYTA